MKVIVEKEGEETVTLEEVDAYDFPQLLIERAMKEGNCDQARALDLLREAKRMLYLKARGAEMVNPSIIVDDAWHAMLLFTREYHKFADFIGVFVHHNPTPPGEGSKIEAGEDAYSYTKRIYEEFLGVKPDPVYWP